MAGGDAELKAQSGYLMFYFYLLFIFLSFNWDGGPRYMVYVCLIIISFFLVLLCCPLTSSQFNADN